MVSSARLAIVTVLLIFSAAVSSQAQTNPEKTANGSITGKVTIKNKGVAGAIVVAEEQNYKSWIKSSYHGTTDQTGSYRIANLPAGTYTVTPMASSLAFENEPTNNSIVVTEGETIEDINFSMIPGGVITGKITDADGKPLIEAYVSLMPIDAIVISARDTGGIRTDDRGIYRAFGLREGKYKVYVGQRGSALPGEESTSYRQTFYPSVSDAAKATVIEVTAGGETANVDIVLGRALPTFKVTGRILDAKTGKPLPKIRYGVYRSYGERGGSSRTGSDVTNVNGEFRLENVVPGKYAVFIVPEDSGVRPDSVSFEVVDRDITDLVIKPGEAASVSGVVVLEGAEGPIKPNSLFLNAWSQTDAETFSGSMPKPIGPDGSFSVGGLRSGFTHFGISSRDMSDTARLELVRVERDGVVQSPALRIKDGEQVTGLRLVFKYLTGSIHGEVKVEGDEPLPNARISVWISFIDPAHPGEYHSAGNSSPQLDSRKRFVVQGLAAGTYEVNVGVFEPGRTDTNRIYKQEVTVIDNAVSEVTVTIKKP